MQEHFIINTDGGARGNPGPAAAGVVIYTAPDHELAAFGQYLGHATNNEAEYRALILALKKLKALIGAKRAKSAVIEVRMDSELIVRQLNGIYKINEEHLKPLFVDVWNLRTDFGKVTFTHIPREQNRHADRMVNTALDQAGGKE